MSQEAYRAATEDALRRVATLEASERQLLAFLVKGYSLQTAADGLRVSPDDAARLKASTMQKLGATVTAELVRVGLYAQVDEGH